ncbi:ATP-binding protein [Variovorax sp. J31P179]|nr:ATP-binding protein [Variovorax sp. J31P179]
MAGSGVRLLALAAELTWAGLTSPMLRAQAIPEPVPVAESPSQPPWNVVTLIGANFLTPSNVTIDGAMRKALMAPGRHPVNLFSEALDAQRFPLSSIEQEFAALLAKKYATTHVDAVVTLGSAALDFAEKHRDELWPDARILFQVVPLESLANRSLSPTTTGIPVQWDIAGTVELALSLRPDTRRLVVIHGSGDFDRSSVHVTRRQLEAFQKRLHIEYWTDASMDQFSRRIEQLSPDDAVLYLSIARDAAGRTFLPREALAQLASVSRAPIYAPFDSYIGHGIVAGSLYSYEALGTRMADLVQEALAAPTTPIPWATITKASCVADARQLEHFGMSQARLPSYCDVRFAPPSLWRDYRWYVVGAVLAILAQSALIFGLVFQRRARRTAEEEARNRRSELMQASRLALAGELTASIAHEINQPLGAILANAGAAEALLRRGKASSDELSSIIADIKKADLRASEVIRRVRALVTSRQSDLKAEAMDSIVGDVLAFLRGEAERRGITIEAALDAGLPQMEVDRVQVQQAIANLCVNAMDAMAQTPQGSRRLGIRLAACGDGGIEIVVTDTGPGVPQDQLPRLFESFFTTKVEGMGLGLSISRSIVEAHDGTLSARNLDAGGAEFRILFPASRRVTKPLKAADESLAASPSRPPSVKTQGTVRL